ncbi:MAG: SprB repeat-containing protein, partial [Chitinophagales bacterium]|nr:SprB repeat-containing protein [Chitinophagales bacterium]
MQNKNYFMLTMAFILSFTFGISGFSTATITTHGYSLGNGNDLFGKNYKPNVSESAVSTDETRFAYLQRCLTLQASYENLGSMRKNSGKADAEDCLNIVLDYSGICGGGLYANVGYPFNGTPPYTYLWSTGETTQVIETPGPGIYCVTVIDSGGCSGSACHEFEGLKIQVESDDTSCGLDNGSIRVTALNIPTRFVTFNWNTGETTSTISALSSGTYTVTATYYNCPEVIETIYINSSDSILVSIDVVDESCNQNNGSISIVPTGTNPYYAYQWSNGEQTQVITDLAAGIYTVTIIDDYLCEAVRTVTVNNLNDFSIANSSQSTSCGLDNGWITATPSDNGIYQYAWSNGQTTQTISELSPGTYTVTVTSDNGCEAVATSTIDSSGQLVLTDETIHTSCGLNNGSISIHPNGGYGFSYLWSNGDTTQTIVDLSPGAYTVTVSAFGGCSEEQTITVNESSPEIETEFEVVHTNCGHNDGIITAKPIGGTDFAYYWSTGDTTQTIRDLAPGNYTVIVTAIGGCSDTLSVGVNSSKAIDLTTVTTPTKCGLPNGSIQAEAVNGDAFEYIWSTGANTQTISDLAPGTYTVTVTNELGCEASATTTLLLSNPLSLSILTFEESCSGCNDASITALANGRAPYSYVWSNGGTSQSIEDLEPGVYAVTVTDDLGCS